MVWLFPAALAGVAAILGPLLVHLLRRQRARTLVVPTVRFVPALDHPVIRVRMPADGWLLLLRMAIVACASLALARPLLLTETRAARWAERIARVVVVDASESAAAGPDADAIAVELQAAAFAHRTDATDLSAALVRAARWLETAPPARREIVVFSDFQLGALGQGDVARVPEGVGLRFVPTRSQEAATSAEIHAGSVLSLHGALRRQARIDESTTAATFTPDASPSDGLRLLAAPGEAEAAASLLRIVARAGAQAPSGSQPIVVRFPGGAPLPPPDDNVAGWPVDAALRLLSLADAADLPLTAQAGAGELLVEVQAAPGTPLAAEALKAALDSRLDPRALAERETARISRDTLTSWTREPGPADPAGWRQSNGSDGRWLWLVALVLLGVETFARRSRPAGVREVEARAA